MFTLRQTSRSVYHAVNIPTIYSYRRGINVAGKTRAKCLEILTGENLMPKNQTFCLSCNRNRDPIRYTWAEGDIIMRAEKTETDFKALANICCIRCNVRSGLHKPGDLIERYAAGHNKSGDLTERDTVLFLDARDRSVTITLCYSCSLLNLLSLACRHCRACKTCCRAANLLLNNGSFPRSQCHDVQACHHEQVIRHFKGNNVLHGDTWQEALHFNKRSRWFQLSPSLQDKILSRLGSDSVLSFRLACHSFNERGCLVWGLGYI